AVELMADGVVDGGVAGGVDAMRRICFMGFNALKLLDPMPCRPFDRDRRGMSIGEGAGFMVLESEARARARRARVYATLAGHGMTTDPFPVRRPDPGGDARGGPVRRRGRRAGAGAGRGHAPDPHRRPPPPTPRLT